MYKGIASGQRNRLTAGVLLCSGALIFSCDSADDAPDSVGGSGGSATGDGGAGGDNEAAAGRGGALAGAGSDALAGAAGDAPDGQAGASSVGGGVGGHGGERGGAGGHPGAGGGAAGESGDDYSLPADCPAFPSSGAVQQCVGSGSDSRPEQVPCKSGCCENNAIYTGLEGSPYINEAEDAFVALDPNDVPHALARSSSSYEALLYLSRGATQWTLETVEEPESLQVAPVQLQIGDDAVPRILFFETEAVFSIPPKPRTFKYGWREAGVWHAETVAFEGLGNYPTFQLDAANRPRIAFQNGADIQLATRTAAETWAFETIIPNTEFAPLKYDQLLMDRFHRLYVVKTSGVYRQESGGWLPFPADLSGTIWGAAVAPDGVVHVLHGGDANSSIYTRVLRSGSVLNLTLQMSPKSYSSLALDACGLPHIAFGGVDDMFRVSYLRWTSSGFARNWVYQGCYSGLPKNILVGSSGRVEVTGHDCWDPDGYGHWFGASLAP